MRLSRHGRLARASSAAALIDSAITLAQHSVTPATSASLAKIAAVRGEKNNAKAIVPARKLSAAAELNAAAARAS
jgi:predicted transcriptional regulator